MSDMLLRIILASYLAIWSPAMCCCGVKAVIGAVTRIETGDCRGVASASAQVEIESDDAAMGSCCAHRDADPACDESQPTDEPSPCRCHESIESKVRLDTGAKVIAPAMTHVSTLPSFTPQMAMFPAASLDGMTPCSEACCGSSHGHGWGDGGPPARSTLLAQRTLLLI